MIFLKERIGKLIQDLGHSRYPAEEPLDGYRLRRLDSPRIDPNRLPEDGWTPHPRGGLWGGHRQSFLFETTATVPPAFAGQCLVFNLITGREGNWDATNPQFSLYVNGQFVQGLDVNHTEAILTEKAVAGEKFRILLTAFTGDNNFSLILDSRLRILDRETERYYYDLKMPFEVAQLLPDDDDDCIAIISRLNESLNLIDLRRVGSREYRESLVKAREYLAREFYGKLCGKRPETVHCVGHTHIDVAWLWPLAVTRDKAVRSFSTVLELMRRHPEYLFMSSQPQLYKYVQEDAPELYREIKDRIAEGRWETDGGMWVEADTNIASGEALVRQFLYGTRYFEREFGKKNEVLWLPDVFGYSAALPQIMAKCGIRYFMTTKISWNEFNKMPCDTFEWEGIDGTRILTHFIPARDFIGPGGFQKGANSYENAYFTTYNGYLKPLQVKGAWQRYQQKHLNNEVLFAFGYGDGGGGPTREQLENQTRLAKGIPGCPQTKMGSVKDFFHNLEKSVAGNRYLPAWVGELYLEYHRGTYTSMARNKRYNRRTEFACQNAETFSLLAGLLAGTDYPKAELDQMWELVLLNQFHDILPGSSIKEVYDDSRDQYETVLAATGRMLAAASGAVAEQTGAPAGSIVVFNPNGFSAAEAVAAPVPAGVRNPVVHDEEGPVATQTLEGGKLLFTARNLPAKGYKSFSVKEGDGAPLPAELSVDRRRLENRWLKVELNDKGQFVSLFDKRSGRELLAKGRAGNVIMSYEDRPHNYDAWDINNYYLEKAWEVDAVESIEIEESGPARAGIRIVRPYLDSRIVQSIRIHRDFPRLDVFNDIDWKENHLLLKTLLPLDIRASEATFDIQFGNVKRPTHANTSWDQARFEVCVHKWLDLSEDGFGVSVLNDCKYGVSVRGQEVGVSMLKSPTYPNPDADKERHLFTWSILPHAGSWREAGTVTQAYQLNNPPFAVVKKGGAGPLPRAGFLVESACPNVIVEAVKRAEDGREVIVRVYECHNRRTRAALRFVRPLAAAAECDLLERRDAPLDVNGDELSFDILPYEIKTFKVVLKD